MKGMGAKKKKKEKRKCQNEIFIPKILKFKLKKSVANSVSQISRVGRCRRSFPAGRIRGDGECKDGNFFCADL